MLFLWFILLVLFSPMHRTVDVQLLLASVRNFNICFSRLFRNIGFTTSSISPHRRLASLNATLFHSQPVLGMNGIDNQIVFNIGLLAPAPMQQFVQGGQYPGHPGQGQQQPQYVQQQGQYAAQPVQYATAPAVQMTAIPAHAAPMDRGQPMPAPPQYVVAQAVPISAPYEKR